MKIRTSDKYFTKDELKKIFSSAEDYEKQKQDIKDIEKSIKEKGFGEIKLDFNISRIEKIKIESALSTIGSAVNSGMTVSSNKQNNFLELASKVHSKLFLMQSFYKDELTIRNRDGNHEIFDPFSESFREDKSLYAIDDNGKIYETNNKVADFKKSAVKKAAEDLIGFIEAEEDNLEIKNFAEKIIPTADLNFIKNVCNSIILPENIVMPKESFLDRVKNSMGLGAGNSRYN